ncbi:origin recognition complex, subunit 2, partial [Amylostereum chailletii]
EDILASTPVFDAYFNYNSQRSRTSTNVFAQLVERLSADEYTEAIKSSFYTLPSHGLPASLHATHKQYFAQYVRELDEGFHLLFYGLGSKRRILNALASERLRKRGSVIVVNAFSPNFGMKDVLAAVEKVPGLDALPLGSQGIEGQLRRVTQFFSSPEPPRPLYLVVHNIDAPALRVPKAKGQLGTLLSSPNIHVLASIDHLNAPLLFSSSGLFTGPSSSASSQAHAWLWHDLTTLDAYDSELAFADRSSLRGASASARPQGDVPVAGAGTNATQMTETAAQHVLLSVTQKAKKLFALLAQHQLDAENEGATEGQGGGEGGEGKAMAYDRLFTVARDDFIATSDAAFRALLAEFRDHGLVVTASVGTLGAAETLWIPLRKERLVRLI